MTKRKSSRRPTNRVAAGLGLFLLFGLLTSLPVWRQTQPVGIGLLVAGLAVAGLAVGGLGRLSAGDRSRPGRPQHASTHAVDRTGAGVLQGSRPDGPNPTSTPEREPIPAKLRFDVLQRDGFRCRYCGRSPQQDGVVLEVDHIVAVSLGGRSELGNLLTACRDCNRSKRARPVI